MRAKGREALLEAEKALRKGGGGGRGAPSKSPLERMQETLENMYADGKIDRDLYEKLVSGNDLLASLTGNLSV